MDLHLSFARFDFHLYDFFMIFQMFLVNLNVSIDLCILLNRDTKTNTRF